MTDTGAPRPLSASLCGPAPGGAGDAVAGHVLALGSFAAASLHALRRGGVGFSLPCSGPASLPSHPCELSLKSREEYPRLVTMVQLIEGESPNLMIHWSVIPGEMHSCYSSNFDYPQMALKQELQRFP